VRDFVVLALVVTACGHAATPATPPRACRLPEPAIIIRDGNAVLVRWDVPDDPVWFGPTLPDDARYRAYRDAIRAAGAELARPIADEPAPTTDVERENWRRERENADLAFGGDAGRVREVHCLDAALFAHQRARHDELVQPTEFVANVLRKGATLRIYLGAGDEMFPPKRVYGLDQARTDVAAGWTLVANLHNHTIQKRGEKPALGTPSPSTSDIQLLRGIADELHLEAVWVTNGVFTGEVPAAALARYHARE